MGSATTEPVEITVFSLKIEKHKLEQAKGIAAKHERSMAQQVRWLIDRMIEEDGRETA